MIYSDFCIFHWLMGFVHLGTCWNGHIWFKAMVGIITRASDLCLLVVRLSEIPSPWGICFWPMEYGTTEKVTSSMIRLQRWWILPCWYTPSLAIITCTLRCAHISEAHMARHWRWPLVKRWQGSNAFHARTCKELNTAYSLWSFRWDGRP